MIYYPIDFVSNLLVKNQIDQIPIVNNEGKLVGIITSWDITNAIARRRKSLRDIMTRNVIVSKPDEYIDVVARRLDKYNINATPVVDDKYNVIGIISTADLIRRDIEVGKR